jgi:hypothetical protein
VPILDRREISFDVVALIGIVAASARVAQAIGLPTGTPRDVEFDVRQQEIKFLYSFTGPPTPIRSNALAALLISYCMSAGIKMPRQIERDIRVEGDAVVIICSTSYMVAPDAAATPPDRTGMKWRKDPE